ncbi:hypothetical protein [Mycobacterium sp. MMS18-G62]
MDRTWHPWDDEDPVEDGDDHDDLAALDFSADEDSDAPAVSEDEVLDNVEPALFTVTNPPGTVTVTAELNGSVHRVDLAPSVTNMTERELAEEIRVIAGLARLKARSVMHQFLVDGMGRMGYDTAGLSAGLTRDMDMPTPEQAAEATAQLFASRYASNED